MYGQSPRFGRHGPGRGAVPTPQPPPPQLNANYLQNHNFYLQTPNFPIRVPNFPLQTLNIPIQNPNFGIQNPNFAPRNHLSSNKRQLSNETLEKINKAVEKALRALTAAGENVSALKVSQCALVILQAESWESLGFQMQQIPSLYRLMLIEGKINAFIHCFVAVWRITTLSDLEAAISKNEGVQRFEELELGPLIRHPLVVHYFCVSSCSTEVFRISSEEIISCLVEFMDTHKPQEVKADELLDFIAKKHSVTSKDKLHVRIQSLGMHIAHIQKARLSENATIKKCLGVVGEKRRKRPLFVSQKKQLDENFSAISERIKSFSSGQGKHIRFVSSSSGDDNSDGTESEDNEDDNCSGSHSKNSSQIKNSSDRVSSCPYPSATEELTRLGILSEKEEIPSLTSGGRTNRRESAAPFKKKRKSDKINCTSSAPLKLPKIDGVGEESVIDKSKNMSCHQDEVVDVSLTNDSMRMFITTWKEACRENDLSEVLQRMLQFYQPPCKPKRRKKEIATFFSAYPCIGLLNVAVKSIKNGMWDSMYDNLQTFEEQEEQVMASEDRTNYVSIEVEPPGNDSQLVTKHGSNQQCDVSVEDILKKVSEFFKDNHDVPGDLSLSTSPVGKIMILLKRIYHCEAWIAEQFAVQKFGCLGYGDFSIFLERQVSLLPPSIQKCFVPDVECEKLALEARIPQQLLEVLLAQASFNLLENENLSMKNVAELLTRQFPSICFKLVEGISVEDLDAAKAKKSNLLSKSVLFSAALSVPRSNSSSDTHVSTKDAVEVLLKAPMLADLASWSHWDLLFAPCLGPLLEWLLNELNTRELLCLVTRSGNIIRIDHTATVDSFLEAFIHGSSFQAAVKLLSLFALYGGERNVPLTLLKCHTEKALEVIMKNSMNNGVKDCENHLMNELNKDKSKVNKGISYASTFFLDFLTYLPVEFRCFAAELFLSGLRSIVKDAPSAILSQCRQAEHLLMLHELGLSLGIMEWINDHNTFSLSGLSKSPELDRENGILNTYASTEGKAIISAEGDVENEGSEGFHAAAEILDHSVESGCYDHCLQNLSITDSARESAIFIESIRREEFGLDPNISVKESCILKKQHARLGRALHCLSQELYSQDSHFLLELVQNADDNVYPCNAEPTLTFILQEGGIIVLNNEQGFSAENIKALCDVGNSTKKEPSAGYIGKKGIGFKSVFRVTDAPEIHSNGFHIKFDISEGQIGFVLPTVVPPCDIDLFSKLVSATTDPMDKKCWNTCIVLPFRSKKTEAFAMDNIISMFSDLHPSLLLFLHRLECIMFKNLLNDSDSLTVMRKEVVGDGIVNVSLGKKKMTWFVKSHKLRSGLIRHDVQTTEISIALMLKEVGKGNYIPKLDHQPVFAFLPLRNYGLKFIIQADFILPSSREEVDRDSPWNQWLLSEFPNLFVSAERSFCSLPCFENNPGKGVSAFMSFVPLGGEVHGFFSSLPRMIISKLRMSNCLLLEGDSNTWVPPCKVLRNWTDQTRSMLPDGLIREHLGLGYLDKDTVLTDSLAQALGIEEYGPRILIQIMTSLCHSGSLKSMGFKWLSSWLNALYLMAFNDTPGERSLDSGTQPDIINTLRQLSFIPLLDGEYASVDEGAIWLHADALRNGVDTEHGLEAFGKLYPKLRIVSPAIFSDSPVENLTQMLHKVGVQRLSAHEVLKVHILPAISDEKDGNRDLMIEYLSFIMFHLESNCPECTVDREHIVSEVQSKAFILTNHGYKRLIEVPIHFSRDFGNPVDMSKLVDGNNMRWFEVDTSYLKHPVIKSVSGGMLKWRKFLQELGVTDFVQIVQVKKSIGDISHTVLKNMMSDYRNTSSVPIFKDWESQELVHLLSHLSSKGDREKCKYVLEVLDMLWDDYFSDKLCGICSINGETKPFKSSLISIFHGIQWLASTMDDELHYAKDLFHDCETVRSVLGGTAPYAIPKVHSVKLLNDIGLRNTVTLDDALSVLQVWRRSKTPFRASISQMSKFYSYIWNEMSISKQKILETLHSGAFIFVPYSFGSTHEVVPGLLLSPKEVYWHDTTGSMEQLKSIHPQYDRDMTHRPFSKMLSSVYPGLHYFFVKELGITENPPLLGYLDSLLQLSTGILPSQAAKTVFQVFQKWTDGLESGLLSSDDTEYLKKRLEEKEMIILPTVLDRWVSLHQSFGLLCWSDDEKLKKEFKDLNNVDFLYLGEHNNEEKKMLQDKVSVLFQRLGIPSLSEVVTHEAIYYGPADSSFETSLVSWALPYAQRYIYNVHPNEYSQLKLSGFKDLNRLRIVVVEKLFYRNVIKRCNIESKKRFECHCLLQDNILYTTRECDSHSLFMELSRFLVAGVPELHLANLLHMITTMVESGFTEEQMEFFIMNRQKLPKLPTEELEWSLQSAPSTAAEVEEILTTSSALALDEPKPPKSTKSGNNSSWPPANWKTAPGFRNALKTQAFGATQMNGRHVTHEIATETDTVGLFEGNADWIIEENLASIPPTVISEEEALKGQSDTGTNMNLFDTNIALKGQSDYGTNMISSDVNVGISSVSGSAGPHATSSDLTKRDQLFLGAATPQQVKTGKLGEVVAFKYFCTKVGEKYVKWVNEVKESGLPFDIVVKGKDKRTEYIEVKATTSARKDWFVITVREWQFAIEKGDSFSIARVVLSGEKSAQVTLYKDPVRLCQLGQLQLAILSPK